jgi:hypothetical protein
MTAIILVTIGIALGWAIGRLQKFGRHVEHDFQQWRDRITAAAVRS